MRKTLVSYLNLDDALKEHIHKNITNDNISQRSGNGYQAHYNYPA